MKKQFFSLLMLCLLALSGTPHVLGQSLGLTLLDSMGIDGLDKVEASIQTKAPIDNSLLASAKSYLIWDVNRDGEVSVDDVVMLIDFILNSTSGDETSLAYDVNLDGEVSVDDVIDLINYILNGPSQEIPVISSAYYYIGTSNYWCPYDATYKLDNGGGDVYANPVFTVEIPASSIDQNWFKIYPQETMEVAQDEFWFSNFIGYPQNDANSMSGTFVEGPNDEVAFAFKIPAYPYAEKYRLTFDMKKRTFKFEVIYASDPVTAEHLFKKCYDYIHGYGDIEFIGTNRVDYVRRLWEANELTTDEAICCWGDPGIFEYNYNYCDASHPLLRDLYSLLYASIGVCNDYLNFCGDYDATKTAEVRFIRAMDYFYLLDNWGNVPLNTSNDAFNSPQVSRAELFQWLEQELLSLRVYMSEPVARKEGDVDYGRVDRDAANLLLARLYLNAQVYTGVARWSDAAQYAKMVMDGPHKLNTTFYTLADVDGNYREYTPYQMLFMGDNGNTCAATEAVFPIPMHGANVDDNNYCWGSSHFLIASTFDYEMHENLYDNSACNGIIYNGTWAGNRACPQLIRLFFPNDDAPCGLTGYEMTYAAEDDRALFNTSGSRTLENTDPSNFKNGYAVAKYNNFKTDGSSGSDPTFPDADFFLMRSAEAYLTYAEALTRQAGGSNAPAEAVSAINAIRARAHALQRSNYSLNQILDEWGREFYFEGRRRMDLIRFNRYGGDTDYLWSWKGGTLSGRNFEAFRNVFAIPEDEVSANPDLVQNPGYDSIYAEPLVIVLSTTVNTVVNLAESDGIPFEWSEPEYYGWPPLKYQIEVSPTNEWMISTDEAAADVTGSTVPTYAVLPTRYTSCNAEISAYELDRALAQICQWGEDNVPDKQTVYVRCKTTTHDNTFYSNVVSLQVKPYYLGPNNAPVELWYLVGEGIGSKDWNNTENSVATGGLVPMYPIGGYEYNPLSGQGLIEYAGYFRAGKGFKLIKDPGRWDDQWGMSDGGFVRNEYDCENITVETDGYYLIRLNTATDELLIAPYGSYVNAFWGITMPGSYQDWNVGATFMNGMSTSVENHDWYLMNVTYDEYTELKFAANGYWDYNWGNIDFPYGYGMLSGPNIPVEAGTYNVFFNDILGTYYFVRQFR